MLDVHTAFVELKVVVVEILIAGIEILIDTVLLLHVAVVLRDVPQVGARQRQGAVRVPVGCQLGHWPMIVEIIQVDILLILEPSPFAGILEDKTVLEDDFLHAIDEGLTARQEADLDVSVVGVHIISMETAILLRLVVREGDGRFVGLVLLPGTQRMKDIVGGDHKDLAFDERLLHFAFVPYHIPCAFVEVDDHVAADTHLELVVELVLFAVEAFPRQEPVEVIGVVVLAVIGEIALFVAEGVASSAAAFLSLFFVFPSGKS